MKKEIWVAAVGYEGYYQISNFGRIRRVKQSKGTWAGRLLKPYPDKNNYLYVTLSKEGIKKVWYVHVLVCTAFAGPKPTPQHEVNHDDGNERNNNDWNLEWCTKQQNNFHKCRVLKRGIGPQHPNFGVLGEKNPLSKTFILTSPAGSEQRVTGLTHFCKTNDLQVGNIYKVMRGKITNHKGWKCRAAP